MPIIESGPLPKIAGTGAKKVGSWPGHEADAKAVYDLAKKHLGEPDLSWACLAKSDRDTSITRLAKVINDGRVVAFVPTPDGHYEACTRKERDVDRWGLWVRFIFDATQTPSDV